MSCAAQVCAKAPPFNTLTPTCWVHGTTPVAMLEAVKRVKQKINADGVDTSHYANFEGGAEKTTEKHVSAASLLLYHARYVALGIFRTVLRYINTSCDTRTLFLHKPTTAVYYHTTYGMQDVPPSFASSKPRTSPQTSF